MPQKINIQDYTIDEGRDGETTRKNLIKLNNKLDTISREVTSWDFYNVQTILTEINGFSSAVNELNNNSSLIIDTNPFTVNDVQYHRGDLIFKKDNKTTLIKSERGGVYYPSRIERESNTNNNFIFSYSFLQYEPKNHDIIKIEPKNNIWTVGEKKSCEYQFMGLNIANTSLSYGEIFLRTSGVKFQPQFNLKKKNDEIISPIIKYYIKKKDDHIEEIIYDSQIEITTVAGSDQQTLTIKNIPDIVHKIVVK